MNNGQKDNFDMKSYKTQKLVIELIDFRGTILLEKSNI